MDGGKGALSVVPHTAPPPSYRTMLALAHKVPGCAADRPGRGNVRKARPQG
jgi:hypothetical protein